MDRLNQFIALRRDDGAALFCLARIDGPGFPYPCKGKWHAVPAGYKIRLLAPALGFPLEESGSGDQAAPLAEGLPERGFLRDRFCPALISSFQAAKKLASHNLGE